MHLPIELVAMLGPARHVVKVFHLDDGRLDILPSEQMGVGLANLKLS